MKVYHISFGLLSAFPIILFFTSLVGWNIVVAQVDPTPTLSTKKRFENLEQRIDELERAMKKSNKDVWDKINSISGLISGGVIAAIGIYVTHVYRKKQRETESLQKEKELAVLQVQTVQSFMPQLQSGDEKAIKAALLAIAALGNSELATKLAQLFRTKGSISALSNIAASYDSKTAQKIAKPLLQALNDENWEVRRAAALALGQIGDTSVIDALSMALSDKSSQVREAVAESLAKLKKTPATAGGDFVA